MNASSTNTQPPVNIRRALIGFLLYMLLIPTIIFISAGTANWPMAWLYVVMLSASTIISRVLVYFKNPDALLERARYASPPEGTLPQDRVLMLIVGSVGPIAMMVTPGLDFRFGWSPVVPAPLQWAAAAILAAGYAFAVWAMVVNRFFSAVVRVQHDRGQTVVTTGPYRFVRHPAYAGSILSILAMPLMLSSYWSILPAVLVAAATVYRTKLEDDLLLEDLSGYSAYARQVRFRLCPGLW